jgi:hypothetical protein
VHRTVLLTEPIGRSNEAIDSVGRSIGGIAESCGLADHLTSTLGEAIATRAWASGTEHRVRWHRPRRSSAPPPSRIATGEERSATGERSIAFDQYGIATRGSLIATCRGARFHQPGGHRHLI